MKLSFKHLSATIALTTLLAFPNMATADHHGQKVDPSGTWTWTRAGRDGAERTSTLTLKADGEELTGKISGRNDSMTDITNGKVKGNEISFDVSRTFNGNTMTISYAAKVDGDKLTGKWSITRDGQERSRDWSATRSPALAGNWETTVERDNGESMHLEYVFDVKEEAVTGKVSVNDFELPLKGTFKEGAVTYRVEMEQDGNTMVATFAGKLEGNKITGKSVTKWNENESNRDLVLTRVE